LWTVVSGAEGRRGCVTVCAGMLDGPGRRRLRFSCCRVCVQYDSGPVSWFHKCACLLETSDKRPGRNAVLPASLVSCRERASAVTGHRQRARTRDGAEERALYGERARGVILDGKLCAMTFIGGPTAPKAMTRWPLICSFAKLEDAGSRNDPHDPPPTLLSLFLCQRGAAWN
jgi:hypothetical protein